MKKYLSISLVFLLIVSMLAVPTFAAKPENPGNSNKTEKVEKDNGKTEKTEKEEKEKNEKDADEVSGATVQSSEEYDTAEDSESLVEDLDEEKIVIEDEKSSDKVNKLLKKWKMRYETYSDEDEEKVVVDDEEIDATDDNDDIEDEDMDEETAKRDKKDKDALPLGLDKRDGELPPGLDKKDVLPYGLLKRIDPDAIPKGHVKDDITGEDIDIETLLVDSVELLDSAVEGDELGQYFNGSIESYDDALTLYTDLVTAGEATEEELNEAAEVLNDAYNTFIMSRTATLDELVDYNDFLDDVSDIIDTVDVGTEEDDDITPENYDALVAYFDTLSPFEVETDEDNNIEPDKVSIEAMLTLFDKATSQFDEFMGFEEDE